MAPGLDRLAVPALDVGGSHVTAALVDANARTVCPGTSFREHLRPDGTAEEILAGIIDCAARAVTRSGTVGRTLGVAMPGPFDYAAGIGRFEGVAKFDALNGVDVGSALRDGLAPHIDHVRFINDADAFATAEWMAGAGRGHDRVVAITIGTGIGSTFLDRGEVIEEGPHVPPIGRVYRLVIDGLELEERVSRRAIMRAAAGHPAIAVPGADVRELAEAARAGDATIGAIFLDTLDALGRALAPWLASFAASVLVVGGSIAESWDLVEPPLTAGLRSGATPWHGPVLHARLGVEAGLIGAALAATSQERADPEVSA